MSATRGIRSDIDGLRAVAVLPVLLFHADLSFSGGFVGVDIFFVISGFLITKMLVSDPTMTLCAFYARRTRRIVPALALITAFSSIAAYVLFMPDELAAFGKSVAATTPFASNVLFWSESGYFDAPRELKPLLHTWSLAVEEQFYIAFPLLLILGRCWLSGRWVAVLLPLCVVSFVASLWLTATHPETAFYLAPTRAWEFLLGSLLAFAAVLRLQSKYLREALGILGLMLIAVSVATYSSHTTFPGLHALPPCAGAALAIWAGTGQKTLTSRVLSWRPLVVIGLLSYSLYLWHWPILVFARYIAVHELSTLVRLCLVMATFPIAWLSWRFIEQPVRAGSYWNGGRLVAGGGAIAAAALSFSVVAVASKGLPGRITPEVGSMLTANYLHDRRDCHQVTIERVKANQVCVRGAAGTPPHFVLVGDSHADAISPAVFAAAERAGLAGYQFTAAGFRPLPGVGSEAMRELSTTFVEFVRANDAVQLVVLSGYWELQARGESYRDTPRVFRDDDYDGSGIAYNRLSFRRGLQRLIDALPNKRIVLIEDVPVGWKLEINYAARAMHIGHVLGSGDASSMTRFGIPRLEYEAQLASYRPILAAAAKAGRVTIVPLIDALCEGDFCPGIRGGALLFRNGDHLSRAGAMLFVDTFYKILAN